MSRSHRSGQLDRRDFPSASCYHLPNFCPHMPASAGSCGSSISARQTEGQFVRDLDAKPLGPLPNASGAITRLAYARAKEMGVDVELLSKKAGLTLHQIEDRSARLRVRDQISFLNLAADALQDELLGFHLAQVPDLREIGLLYYVGASSETLSVAVQRVARYSSVINEGVSIKYIDGKDVVIAFRYVGVSRHQDTHQTRVFYDGTGPYVPTVDGPKRGALSGKPDAPKN